MLVIRDLAVAYGPIRAVRSVSLEVRTGEIVTLVGGNGAGKSSTLNAVAGLVRPAGGRIELEGAPVGGLPAHRLVARGEVVLVHSDVGSGDEASNARIAAYLSQTLPPALAPGALVLSDQELSIAGAKALPLPDGVKPGRYFLLEMP